MRGLGESFVVEQSAGGRDERLEAIADKARILKMQGVDNTHCVVERDGAGAFGSYRGGRFRTTQLVPPARFGR